MSDTTLLGFDPAGIGKEREKMREKIYCPVCGGLKYPEVPVLVVCQPGFGTISTSSAAINSVCKCPILLDKRRKEGAR